MAVDHIRYDILAREALRGVVRTVIADAAAKGLPGDHHFQISFDTQADDVRLSQRMRAQYPEEMTIILQHQFWDLVVTDEGFEVGLSFGGAPERISIPFAAITAFFDPSVQFGVRFEQIAVDAAAEVDETDKRTGPAADASPARPPAPQTGPRPAPVLTAVPTPANAEPPSPDSDPDKPAGGGEVVRLDRFRKK